MRLQACLRLHDRTHSYSAPPVSQQPDVKVNFPSTRASRILEARRVAEMVHRLPTLVYYTTLPGIVQQACLESFFTNTRALIEFLEVRGARKSAHDFFASDIAAGWSPSIDKQTQDRLEGHWDISSKHLMHFSKVRAVQDNGTVVNVDTSMAALEMIATEVLAVWDQFAAAADHPLAPQRADFSMTKEFLGEP